MALAPHPVGSPGGAEPQRWLLGDGMVWASYAPDTGELGTEVEDPRASGEFAGELPDGWYRWLNGTLVAFYGAGGKVWLRIGAITKACTSPASVDWVRQANGMARLSLLDGSEIVASVVYFGGDPWGIPPELDSTMTEPEDFDFGEFVRRKIDDEANLRRIFGDDIEFDPTVVLSRERRVDHDPS